MNNPDIIQDVTDFMLAMGQSRQVVSSPEIPEPDIQTLRSKLNREEYGELTLAWDQCANMRKRGLPSEAQAEALADLADGIADLIYVLVGHANAYGIPLAKVWREVQRANMAKLWTYDEVCTITRNKDFSIMGYELLPSHNGWKIEAVDLTRNGVGLYNVRKPDGKVAKPPSFQPPDIKQIILEAMAKAEPPDYEP